LRVRLASTRSHHRVGLAILIGLGQGAVLLVALLFFMALWLNEELGYS
jgi:hypothetical protein